MSRRGIVLGASLLLTACTALLMPILARHFRSIAPDAVVLIDGEPLTFADLRRYLRHDGYFESPSEATSWANRAIEYHLLAREDRRNGGEGNSEAAVQREQQLVAERNPIDDGKVAQEYERRLAEFVHPARARVEYLSFPVADDAERARSQMEKAFVLVQVAQGKPSQGPLVREAVSSEAIVSNGGPFPCEDDENQRDSGENAEPVPLEVRKAACRLRDGAVSLPFLSRDGRFGFVISSSWKQRARNVSLQDAAPKIRTELERDVRVGAANALVRKLRESAKIEIIDENVLAEMVRESGTSEIPSNVPPGRPGTEEVQGES